MANAAVDQGKLLCCRVSVLLYVYGHVLDMCPWLAALQELNLPPEQELRLLMDILKTFSSPARMPDFLKRRRKQSRAIVPNDLMRPFITAEKHALFHHCYQLHTKNKRTDWLGATREFNMAVCNTWDTIKPTCNLYLKNEHHMQGYSKKFLMQASHAEVNQLSSAISGLPASEAPVCRQPVQLRAPGQGDGASLRTGGVGGRNKPRKCPDCTRVLSRDVWGLGHSCVEYLIRKGRDPLQATHTRGAALKRDRLPTVAEARKTLTAKKKAGLQNRKRKTRDIPDPETSGSELD